MTRRLTLLTGIAGLLGALSMWAGDQLFAGGAGYPPWSNGHGSTSQLLLGVLLAVPGGVGLVLGVGHLKARLAPAPGWARVSVTLSFLTLFVLAVVTHGVWGAFYMEVDENASVSDSNIFVFLLSPLEDLGKLIGVPAALGLLALNLFQRTTWPAWMIAFNPGVLYVLIGLADDLIPGPVGLVLLHSTFNLSWVIFFLASLLAPSEELAQ